MSLPGGHPLLLVLLLAVVGGGADCGPGTELLTCLKTRLAGALERAVRARRDIQLLPGLSLVPNEALENELLPRAASEVDPKEVDGLVLNNLAAFFRTHSLQLRLAQLPSALRLEEGRGKKRRGAHNLLMMMFMMASMMLPLKMGTLAMLAGKALIISKLALALAAIVGLKKLLGNDDHQDSYQVVQVPAHGHRKRSTDYLDLPYRAHS